MCSGIAVAVHHALRQARRARRVQPEPVAVAGGRRDLGFGRIREFGRGVDVERLRSCRPRRRSRRRARSTVRHRRSARRARGRRPTPRAPWRRHRRRSRRGRRCAASSTAARVRRPNASRRGTTPGTPARHAPPSRPGRPRRRRAAASACWARQISASRSVVGQRLAAAPERHPVASAGADVPIDEPLGGVVPIPHRVNSYRPATARVSPPVCVTDIGEGRRLR